MKKALKLSLSLAMTVACSWYAFRGTNWHDQWESLRAANYWWLIPYVAVLLVVHLLRTLRWGALLSGLEKVRFRQLNEASAIGFMMLIVLPLRLGEFARPFLIANRSGIRRSPAMATVVVERIADGILVAALLRALLFFIPKDAPGYATVSWAGNIMFLIFAGGAAFLVFALWQEKRAVRFIQVVLGRSPKLAAYGVRMVEGFVGALRRVPSRRELAKFFGYTVVYWAVNGAGMAMMAFAFEAPAAGVAEPLRISLFQAYAIMCTLVVAVMIPSAPGMVGTFQAGIRFGLGLFLPAALVNGKGLAYANVVWLCQTGQQVGLGLLLMFLGNLSFKEIAGGLTHESEAERAEPQPELRVADAAERSA